MHKQHYGASFHKIPRSRGLFFMPFENVTDLATYDFLWTPIFFVHILCYHKQIPFVHGPILVTIVG